MLPSPEAQEFTLPRGRERKGICSPSPSPTNRGLAKSLESRNTVAPTRGEMEEAGTGVYERELEGGPLAANQYSPLPLPPSPPARRAAGSDHDSEDDSWMLTQRAPTPDYDSGNRLTQRHTPSDRNPQVHSSTLSQQTRDIEHSFLEQRWSRPPNQARDIEDGFLEQRWSRSSSQTLDSQHPESQLPEERRVAPHSAASLEEQIYELYYSRCPRPQRHPPRLTVLQLGHYLMTRGRERNRRRTPSRVSRSAIRRAARHARNPRV